MRRRARRSRLSRHPDKFPRRLPRSRTPPAGPAKGAASPASAGGAAPVAADQVQKGMYQVAWAAGLCQDEWPNRAPRTAIERHIAGVSAWVVGYKLETESDWHVVIHDAAGRTIR